jgi:S-ribosylhomocysteine lyase LuxS involved in autoinducer biosynthesis
LLHDPDVLNVKYTNSFTLDHQSVIPGQVAVGKNNQTDMDTFMIKQKQLRGIA